MLLYINELNLHVNNTKNHGVRGGEETEEKVVRRLPFETLSETGIFKYFNKLKIKSIH